MALQSPWVLRGIKISRHAAGARAAESGAERSQSKARKSPARAAAAWCGFIEKIRSGRSFGTAAISLALALTSLQAAPKWRMQYFYDKEGSTLSFSDIQCPSAKRCYAAGILDDGKHDKGVIASTSDGGANWTLEDVKDHPISLFFLNDNTGWMITDRGLWATDAGSKGWKKIKDQKGLVRVYFVNENRGWLIGAPKLVLETNDGGHKWAPVAAAAKAPTAPENTVYHWIDFEKDLKGMIVGSWSLTRDPDEIPEWMAPSRVRLRREYPSVTIMLQTTDDGKDWSELSSSLQGSLSRFRYLSLTTGLGLFEFPSSAEIASELIKFDMIAKSNTSVYRNPDRAVRDFMVLPGGDVILAAIERQGKANLLPIPGKLRMMQSSGAMKTWVDTDIDYRAVAQRAILAAAGDNVWVATDTGMILKLTP